MLVLMMIIGMNKIENIKYLFHNKFLFYILNIILLLYNIF